MIPQPMMSIMPNYNPYQQQMWQAAQQMNAMQQSQPQMIQQGLSGKLIGSLNDATPNDVPMDGSCALFPMSDYSKIYIKRWNTNGTISTVEYVPNVVEQSQTQDNTSISNSIDLTPIMARLDELESKLLSSQNKTLRTQRKEGESV